MSQAAPKHTGNGSNNLQKAQGQLLHTANLSSKPKTPKPKHPHPLTGGHSPAQNPVLSSPPRPGNVQPSPSSGVHGNKVGQNVFQDQTLTSKQNGHPRPDAQKAQNHAPTPQIFPTHQQPTNSGKNTTNGKVQTTTQHTRPGGKVVSRLSLLTPFNLQTRRARPIH
ncbi:hypothetical protein L208DRAFT_947332 [Tricholoma matsutake]|nr:hypothetical protein L208DRAFT_947332 [Tricholoma matsutake 945]